MLGPDVCRPRAAGCSRCSSHLSRLRRHLGRGPPELVRQYGPRPLPITVFTLAAAALAGALQIRRSLQLRRGLRHDRSGAQPRLAARDVRDPPPAQRVRRHRRFGRVLEAGSHARRRSRRLHRRAVSRADAQLLRPNVQQPEGYTVCRRLRLGDLLLGSPGARVAATAAAAGVQDRGRDRPDDGGADRRPLAAVLPRSAPLPVRRMGGNRPAQHCSLVRHRTNQPLADFLAGRRHRLRSDAPVLAVGAERADSPSARRPRGLFARDLPDQDLVQRADVVELQPALELSADLYRPGSSRGGPRAAALCHGIGGGRDPAGPPAAAGGPGVLHRRRQRSSSRSAMRSRSRLCCSTACAISSLCCR